MKWERAAPTKEVDHILFNGRPIARSSRTIESNIRPTKIGAKNWMHIGHPCFRPPARGRSENPEPSCSTHG